MLEYLISGFILGLSLGVTCLATCGPIYAPILLMEKRSLTKTIRVILEISLGRFITYSLFGLIAGLLGAQLSNGLKSWATGFMYVGLSIFLAFYIWGHSKVNHKGCKTKKMIQFTKSSPFLIGVVTGISFCPSFLIALTSAFQKSGAISGMLFFAAFFFGTTLFMLPMSFIGFIPFINMKVVKYIGYAATILVIIWFSSKGIDLIVQNLNTLKKVEQTTSLNDTVNFLEVDKIYLLVNDLENDYSKLLKFRLKTKVKDVEIIQGDKNIKEFLRKDKGENYTLLTYDNYSDEKIKKSTENYVSKKKGYVFIIKSPENKDNVSHSVDEVLEKLDYYNFRVKDKGFLFSMVKINDNNTVDSNAQKQKLLIIQLTFILNILLAVILIGKYYYKKDKKIKEISSEK